MSFRYSSLALLLGFLCTTATSSKLDLPAQSVAQGAADAPSRPESLKKTPDITTEEGARTGKTSITELANAQQKPIEGGREAHTNIGEAEKIKAAAEVQRLLAEMRQHADQPDFKLDLSGTSSKDNAAAETANSQTRRKLLQFGYDPQLLLNEVYLLGEIQRLEFLVQSAQSQLQYLQNLYNGVYQQSLAFAPGGAFNPAGRRLMANSKLLETNLEEASKKAAPA